MRALKRNHINNTILHLYNGEEALGYFFDAGSNSEKSGQEMPKVIFLDLKMPKVGGLEVLKRLKSDERTCRIPVVMLTSSKEDQDIARAYELGANSYIVKPVNFENFSKAIVDIMEYWLVLNQHP